MPASHSWIMATSRAMVGQATPWRAAMPKTGAICASTGVRRRRTHKSRQMPEWVFALGRLNATIAAMEAAVEASVEKGHPATRCYYRTPVLDY